MMKKVILSVFFLILLMACSDIIEVQYYHNGNLKLKAEKKDGKRNGELIEYYEDGTIKSIGEWKNGVQNGKVEHYYPNGILKSVAVWENGKEVGGLKKYYKTGKIWNTATFENGVKVGESIFYYENGKVLEKQIFTKKGEMAYFVKFDTAGSVDIQSVLLIFDPEKDTVNIGENYKVNIHFGVDLSGEVKLIIGKFDKNYNLIDTTAILTGNESKEFNYAIVANKAGVNTVPILVHHIPDKSDTLSADGLIVKHTFFVKGSEVVN